MPNKSMIMVGLTEKLMAILVIMERYAPVVNITLALNLSVKEILKSAFLLLDYLISQLSIS
ncbi:hypothetical protein GCM10022246_18170 [Pedobacter ginsengiterrae]|uniref:Uncharacterized protein n=1 Tax=Pedobacter ginsengiterrae TaxID=871696 RepID=A0ABP7PHY3_9SPHI